MSEEEYMSEAQAQAQARLKQMKSEQQTLASKISEMEIELHEHNLVITALEKLENGRRCYRLVGDVLVERTVSEVMPAVQKNRDGIKEVTQQLKDALQKKVAETNEFIIKNNLHLVRQNQSEATETNTKASTGVLV